MTNGNGKSINSSDVFIFLGRYGTVVILLAMIAIFSILMPAFRSGTNLYNLGQQMSILSIFAAGMTCCLKMGDFDLSIGAIAAITGIVISEMMLAGYSIPTSIIVGILVGVVVGLLNGLLVAYVGLSAFVCTLATMSVILGMAMAITKGISIWGLPETYGIIGRGDLAGIPNRFILMIVLIAILWFFHGFTTTGRRMEAIGGNANAARMSGINVEFNRLLGYLLSGLCSAIAGIVLTSTVLSASALQGTHYLLDAFGACFIGAATLRIGQFHILGTFVGVLIVVVAINGLLILMVPGYYTDMIKGIILLLAIFFSGVAGRFIKS